MLRTVLLLSAVLAFAACDSQPPTSPSTPSELRAAPTSIVVDGKTITLRASLWRDFMPISPPDGKPLVAAALLQTSDGSAVPATLEASTISVLFGADVWTAPAVEERPRAETAPAYEVVAREGPKWGPNVNVDVVVRLTNGGRSWLLRAADQRIAATF